MARRYILIYRQEHAAHIEDHILEDPGFVVTVDTEAELDAALADGLSVSVRGEGFGGVIDCTTRKRLTRVGQGIRGPGHLRFNLDPGIAALPRAIELAAARTYLQDLELSSIVPVNPSNTMFAIALSEVAEELPHGARLSRLNVHNWNRCLSKEGTDVSPVIRGVRVEGCEFRTFSGDGVNLSFGLRGLKMVDCDVEGRQSGESHATANGVTLTANVHDCTFEDVRISRVTRYGFESLIADYVGTPTTVNERTVLRNVRTSDTGGYGISVAHGKGTILDACRVKNAVGIGLELASQANDLSWGDVLDCEVDGVTGSGWQQGMAIDKVVGARVMGGVIKNVSSSTANQAIGMQVYEAEKCLVHGVEFVDCGDFYLYFHKGAGVNTGGRHTALNNVFRQSAAVAGRLAIYVFDTNVVARNNTSYQRSGGGLRFAADVNSGAGVRSENNVVCPLSGDAPAGPKDFDLAQTTGGFVSSNLIMPIP